MENYAKMVKEMHWPKASIKKAMQLEQIKATLKHLPLRKSDYDQHPSTEKKPPGSYNRPWRDGNRNSVVGQTEKRDYSPLAKGQLKNLAHDKSAKAMPKGSLERRNPKSNRDFMGTESKTYDGQSTEDNVKKPKIDYLAELRKDRINKGKAPANRTIDSLMADKKLTEEEKLEAATNKAQLIEKQAAKKEQLLQLNKAGGVQDGNPENIKQTLAVNDMYVEAI